MRGSKGFLSWLVPIFLFLLAFGPRLYGLGTSVHSDGPLASYMILSALFLIVYLRDHQQGPYSGGRGR